MTEPMTEQERPRTGAGRRAQGVIEAGVNPQWQGLEKYGGSVSNYAASIILAIEAEGRQQAVTVERLGEAIGKVIPRNEPVPYWLTANLHRIVAGFNASESPHPGEYEIDAGDGKTYRFSGDASESPSTRDADYNCGFADGWEAAGGDPDAMPVGDASESPNNNPGGEDHTLQVLPDDSFYCLKCQQVVPPDHSALDTNERPGPFDLAELTGTIENAPIGHLQTALGGNGEPLALWIKRMYGQRLRVAGLNASESPPPHNHGSFGCDEHCPNFEWDASESGQSPEADGFEDDGTDD